MQRRYIRLRREKPKTAGKLDWVALSTFIGTIIVIPTISTIVGFGLYLNSTLHQTDIRIIRIEDRIIRIEDRLGIPEPGFKLTQK